MDDADIPSNTPWHTRWAFQHPFQISLVSAVLLFGVFRANHSSTAASLIAAASIFVLQVILWFPKYGPARRYSLRWLRDHPEYGRPQG